MSDPGQPQTKSIHIIGAGIGGLTLGLSLAQAFSKTKYNIPLTLYEQAKDFSPLGGGLQISPNSAGALIKLGLKDALSAIAYAPDQLLFATMKNNSPIAHYQLGKDIEAKFGAPYYVIERAALQYLLLEKLKEFAFVKIKKDYHFLTFKDTFKGSTKNTLLFQTSDGQITKTIADQSIIIGTDGIWSNLRGALFPGHPAPSHTGYRAWRAAINPDQIKLPLTPKTTHVWLGAKAHLVAYQIAPDKLNLVAITSALGRTAPSAKQHWNVPVKGTEIIPFFKNAAPDIRAALQMIEEFSCFDLYQLAPLKGWHKGCAVLIGDSAHPVLPFLAQGAGMAIEDAVVLTPLISDVIDNKINSKEAFHAFEKNRIKRTKKTAKKSRQNGRIYHLGFGADKLRNMAMRNLSNEKFYKKFAWLYEGV